MALIKIHFFAMIHYRAATAGHRYISGLVCRGWWRQILASSSHRFRLRSRCWGCSLGEQQLGHSPSGRHSGHSRPAGIHAEAVFQHSVVCWIPHPVPEGTLHELQVRCLAGLKLAFRSGIQADWLAYGKAVQNPGHLRSDARDICCLRKGSANAASPV